MRIELSAPRARFVVEETVEVTVRLHNDGPAPVRTPDPLHNDAWQPTYVLTGPEFPQGRRFSARSATSRDSPSTPPDVPQVMVELGPGQSHEGELPLSQWCPVTTPGAYTLVAELDHAEAGGERIVARSNVLAFELEALAAQGVSVGVDVLRRPPGDLHVSFVHAGAGGPVIHDALVVEDRPDLGELERASLGPRRTVAPGVGAVLVPWCNVDRMTAIAAWRAWQDGGALVGDDSPLGQPVSLALPSGASVLPPAWQGPSEALDVLVLEADRRRLALARFESHGPPTPPTAALAWRSDAREPIVAARLAVGPAAAGSVRRAIALEAHGEDLLVSCFAVEPGAGGAPIGRLLLPKVEPVPGLGLALRVTPDAHTKVWLLVDAKRPGAQVYMAHAIFDAGGKLVGGGDRFAPLVALDVPLVEAALELALPEDRGPEELVWALRTDDRRVLWSRAGRAPRWLKTPRPTTVATPMQLRPLSEATYLATLRPGRMPELVTLEDR